MQRTETVREILIRVETKVDAMQEAMREMKHSHRDARTRIDKIERKVYIFSGLLLGLELSLKLFWNKLIGGGIHG